MAFISLLFCLLLVFFQDWKYRRIHVSLPLAIFLCSFHAIQQENSFLFKNIVCNLGFLWLTLSILTLYMSLKKKHYSNPFQNYFGIGDLLFYSAIAPLFILENYIVFFILSMVFALALQAGLKKIITENTVPLAGYSSLFLCMAIINDSVPFFEKITLL